MLIRMGWPYFFRLSHEMHGPASISEIPCDPEGKVGNMLILETYPRNTPSCKIVQKDHIGGRLFFVTDSGQPDCRTRAEKSRTCQKRRTEVLGGSALQPCQDNAIKTYSDILALYLGIKQCPL